MPADLIAPQWLLDAADQEGEDLPAVVAHDNWHGIPWVVAKHPMGHRCGYVLLPEGHPWWALLRREGVDLDEVAEAHGGITYTDDEGWIGFDAMHAFDRWVEVDLKYAAVGIPTRPDSTMDHWWTDAEITVETAALAARVRDAYWSSKPLQRDIGTPGGLPLPAEGQQRLGE